MFLVKEKDRIKNGLTVGEAIDEYISSKENILSPTTIHCYREIKRNNLSELCNIPIEKLSPETVQKHFNRLALKKSPKTLSNAHGLLVSVVNVYAPEIRLKTTLPKKQKKIKKFPERHKSRHKKVVTAIYSGFFCFLRGFNSPRLHQL